MKFIYLDTWALRELAEKHNSDHAWREIHNAISTNKVWLIISVIHLFELAKKKDIKHDTIVNYLDKCENIKWLPAPHEVFKKEVESAVQFLLNNKKIDISVYYDSFAGLLADSQLEKQIANGKIPDVILAKEIKYNLSQPKKFSEINSLLIKLNSIRDFDRQLHRDADRINRRNKNAAIRRNPKCVLRLVIKHYLERVRSVNPNGSDNQFVDKLVRLSAEFMPSLVLFNSIARLTFGGIKVKATDLYDIYHACYLPYCDLMLVDKGIHDRVKQTRSNHCSKIFCKVIAFSQKLSEK